LVVQRNLDRLSKSIGALLDFSRMDMGRVVVHLQPFNFPQLVEQVVTTLRSELERKQLRFELHVEPHLPQVIADRERVSQVLENLIINAMKFTPEHGVIGVHAARRTTGGRAGVDVRVTDTGIGIPRAQLDKIFNRFYQVDGSSTRRVGGVGLGLSIVKIILEGHGSSISVDSQEGQGTEFRFTLPALERAAPETRTRSGEGTVLVVDDQPEFLLLMRTQLEAEGFEVLTAATAAEGRDLAARVHPDAIVLDVLLPDTNGFDLLRDLKHDPETASIPVLVVSIAENGLRAFALGATDWLRKPLDAEEALRTLRRLVDGSHAAEPLVLLADDELAVTDTLRETLKAEGFRVAVARDGREALEVLQQRRPDVVLLDIMMPNLSGFELLETMGRTSGLEGIPVVILSARGDEADTRRGIELGARRFISKPFDVRELVAELRLQAGGRPSGASMAEV
jgi:adenylate cyclase